MINAHSFVRLTLALTLCHAIALPAQQAPLPGFTPAASAAERTLEAQAIARPDAARARDHSRALSAETHVSGTPAQERPCRCGALRRVRKR
jgi:N-acetylated-alpha-linked acidic dipeptidase